MKGLIKIVFLIFILGGVILNIACTKKKIFKRVTWEGTLYDSIGGKPVEGYWITLNACYPMDGRNSCETFPVASSQTDASGHFKIGAQAARSNRYFAYWGNASIQDDGAGALENYKTIYLYNP